jgi:hypothetical protein
MATDHTGDTTHGLCVPDALFNAENLWAEALDIEQDGRQPGLAEPAGSYPTGLEVSGVRDNGDTIDVRVQRQGRPKRGRAGVAWRTSGDEDESDAVGGAWRGQDVPTVLNQAEAIVWASNGTSQGACYMPRAAALPTGEVLVAFRFRALTGSFNYNARLAVRDLGTRAWSFQTIYETGQTSWEPHPELLVMPDDVLLLFHWVVNTTTNEGQIRVHQSTDEGATWAEIAPYVLETALDTSTWTPGRIAAGYANGQILLVVESDDGSDALLTQYASSDGGMSFSHVETWAGGGSTGNGFRPDIVTPPKGGFVVGYLRGSPLCRRISNAFIALSTESGNEIEISSAANWESLAGSLHSSGDLAMWTDDRGVIYAAGRNVDGAPDNDGLMARSLDGGATWSDLGQSSSASAGTSLWSSLGSANSYFQNYCGVYDHRSRHVIIGGFESQNQSSHEYSLMALYAGGPSTVTMPGYSAFPDATSRVSWEETGFFFVDLPEDLGWSKSLVGTGAVAHGEAGVNTQASATGDVAHYTKTFSGTQAEGLLFLVSVDVQQGGDRTAPTDRINVQADNHAFGITFRFDTTGFRVVDHNNANAQVGSDVTISDMTAGVHVLVWVGDGGEFACWYMARSTRYDRKLLAGPSSSSLTAGATATVQLRFGCTTGPVSGTDEANWQFLNLTSDQWTGQGLTDFQNPASLFWRGVTADVPVHVARGLKMRFAGQLLQYGWSWSIPPRYLFGIDRAFPDVHPSPLTTWRSTDTSADQLIAFQRADGAKGPYPTSPAMFVYLGNINLRDVEILGWDPTLSGGAGGWETIASVNATWAGMTALPFVRRGDCLIVDTGTAYDPAAWLPFGEARGCTVKLTPSAGPDVYRKIEGWTDGAWTDETTKRPVLRIRDGDFDDTEPASGTLEIWSRRLLVILTDPYPSSLQPLFTGWGIKVPAHDTADGYFEAGVVAMGPYLPFGKVPDNRRVVELEDGAVVEEFEDGTVYIRRPGAPAESVQLAWSESTHLLWTGELYETPKDVGFIRARTGGDPAAAPAAQRQLVMGLFRQLNGRPCIYAPHVSVASGGSPNVVITQSDRAFYGKFGSRSVRSGNVWGEENAGELARIDTLTLVELPQDLP